MARLNEQPVSADSLEILRRKFLRQNRDIARINSTQSLRIRGLENECARLLSENLGLKGQILRLEKELQDNSAQRIADHALEIKAKLETQLIEWGSMLASLGLEPPSKRHSPDRRNYAKPRPSQSRSPLQRRVRESLHEGKLPPIYENKAYPRATMNSAEILALVTEAADTSNSPDLGPPPVSRYVEEDPVKVDSPSWKGGKTESDTRNDERPTYSESALSPPKLDYNRTPTITQDVNEETEDEPSKAAQPEKKSNPPKDAAPAQTPIIQPVKAGAKRKFGDENAGVKAVKGQSGKVDENTVDPVKVLPDGDIPKKRSIKELPASRREKATGSRAGAAPRRPLAAKSTNDDMSSPRKVLNGKPPMLDEVQPAKVQELKEILKEQRSTRSAAPPRMDVLPDPEPTPAPPPPPPPPTITALPEPETPLPVEPIILHGQDTPCRSSPRDAMPSLRDTPPPAHISTSGETSRPSRRARAAVSYAEPNLRDKMRRPTSQLVDAVTGEGKFSHRPQKSASDEATSAPTSISKTIKSEPGTESSSDKWRTLPVAEAPMSPLARKEKEQQSPDILPSSVVMERRKRPSTRESILPLAPAENPESCRKSGVNVDVYDFASSSPVSSPSTRDTTPPEEDGGREKKPTRGGRNNRRSSAAVVRNNNNNNTHTQNNGGGNEGGGGGAAVVETVEVTAKCGGSSSRSRKSSRSSMLAPKRPVMNTVDDDATEDAAAAADDEDNSTVGGVLKDRISRRRSMML